MSNNIKIDIQEVIQEAWQKLKGQKRHFWGAILLIALTALFLFPILKIFHISVTNSKALLGVIILNLFMMLASAGLLYQGWRVGQNLPISLKTAFETFKSPIGWNVVGCIVIIFLIEYLPELLLQRLSHSIFISAITFAYTTFISVRTYLALGFIFEKNLNPMEAIKSSFNGTQGNSWRIFLLYIVQTMFLLLSLITLGIALIWTIPFMFVMFGVVYKKLVLENQNKGAESVVIENESSHPE